VFAQVVGLFGWRWSIPWFSLAPGHRRSKDDLSLFRAGLPPRHRYRRGTASYVAARREAPAVVKTP
jgi:hypothetical protein